MTLPERLGPANVASDSEFIEAVGCLIALWHPRASGRFVAPESLFLGKAPYDVSLNRQVTAYRIATV